MNITETLEELDRLAAQIIHPKDNVFRRMAEAIRAEMSQPPGIDSDSIVASCNCLTISPNHFLHRHGCKYRLICERDEARKTVKRSSIMLSALQQLETGLANESEHGMWDADYMLDSIIRPAIREFV